MSLFPAQPPARTSGKVPATAEAVLAHARQVQSHHRFLFEGTQGDVVRLPDAAINELVSALSGAVSQGICQIVPFTSDGAASSSFSQLMWRNLATKDVSVQRLYVVPPGEGRPDLVDKQIEADKLSRADSRKLDIGAVREWGRLPLDYGPLTELWLIDDRAVVTQEFNVDAPVTWLVSVRDKDVRRARALWSRLWEAPPTASDRVDLTEPLLESASMIQTMAPMSCTHSYVDRDSCSWYHGVWQYLRLFDMVSSPAWHSGFYRTKLREAIEHPGLRRVLITGAADYSMLAYVIAAAQDANKAGPLDLEAHVLDLCPTPLSACRWYAGRLGLHVHLHEVDMLADKDIITSIGGAVDGADDGFDTIVTDAFLTRFSRDEVATVLDNWRALLRTGGRVVTTVRLAAHDGGPAAARSSAALEVFAFALRLRQRALGLGSMMRLDLDALLDRARDYALKMTSTDLGDRDSVLDLVAQHGFDIVEEQTCDVEGELTPSTYLRVVIAKA